METFAKRAEGCIAFSAALVSSFVIYSFRKKQPVTPYKSPASVAAANTAKAVAGRPADTRLRVCKPVLINQTTT